MLSDLCFALRLLRRSPGFTAMAVISLALGIAANTTVFSLIDAMFYSTPPVRDPATLVNVYRTAKTGGIRFSSYPIYAALHQHSGTLADLAAHYSTAPLNVITGVESGEIQGAVVSGNYFSMLGIHPLLGRFFLAEEDQAPGRNPVAVIGFGMWQRRFRGDPSVLGRELTINGVGFRVVGVAPEEFHGVSMGTSPNEIWIPTMMLTTAYRFCDGFTYDCTVLSLIGRLAPGRRLEDAQAELSAVMAEIEWEHTGMREGGVLVERMAGIRILERREYSNQMRLLAATAGLLLLLACVNVAGLLSARGVARRRELAVRLSLGAPRMRLVRQLITESLLLALAGGAVGLMLTLWTRNLLLAFFAIDGEGYHSYYDLRFDPRVLGYSLALTLFTGLLFGLLPALHATRPGLAPSLKLDAATGLAPQSRLRAALMMAQVALSLVLLIGAVLLVRSVARLGEGVNFNPRGVAVLRLRPLLIDYSPARAQALTREAVQRIEALPGVDSVSLGRGQGLVWTGCCDTQVRKLGQAQEYPAGYHVIAPHYFNTLSIPMLAGRDFDSRDRVGSPAVAIVNETMARRLWPRESPLGRMFRSEEQVFQVVGVVKDAQIHNVLEPSKLFFYTPFWQSPEEVDSRMAVRVNSDPRRMLPLLHRTITAIDSRVPLTEEMTMLDQVEAKYVQARLASSVMLTAGVLALLLSATGLYSVIAFIVSRRTREIGIRMALGARPGDVRALVLRQGLKLVAPGVALGLAGAFASTHLLQTWLYGVRATDPWAFATGALLLSAAALAACAAPARRAARLDPMVALRDE